MFVGSIIDQQKLCESREKKQLSLSPIVDQVFLFPQPNDNFDYLYSAQHQNKVIIKVKDQ